MLKLRLKFSRRLCLISQYNTPDNLCFALETFIIEIREQSAALRAYDNVFQNKQCDNSFFRRSYESIWRELLSEIARIFDKESTGSSENCTLLRLKELCLNEHNVFLFPSGGENDLLKTFDAVFESYKQLPIGKSRKKQLAHHDLKQVIAGKPIEISLEQIEQLIESVTDVFAKIYSRFNLEIFEASFTNYDVLVEKYEKDIRLLV